MKNIAAIQNLFTRFSLMGISAGIIILAFFFSCSKEAAPQEFLQEPILYVWSDNFLNPVESTEDLPSTELLPWTEKERVMSIVSLDQNLYCGVNRKGLLQLTTTPLGVNFELRTDPFFKERTLQSVFTYGNQLAMHLFYNSHFGKKLPVIVNGNLVYFSPADNKFSQGLLPFISRKGEEVTGLIPRKGGDWAMEIKDDRKDRVYFKHYLYHPGYARQQKISASEFRSSYDFILPPDAPAIYRYLIEALQKRYSDKRVVHLTLYRDNQTYPERYQIGSTKKLLRGEAELIESVGFWKGDRMALVLPENELLFLERNGEVSNRFGLPRVMRDLKITSFLWNQDGFYFTWEQQDFFLVGNSGLLFLPRDYFSQGTQIVRQITTSS